MQVTIKRDMLKTYTPTFTTSLMVSEELDTSIKDDKDNLAQKNSDNSLMPLIRLLHSVHIQKVS